VGRVSAEVNMISAPNDLNAKLLEGNEEQIMEVIENNKPA
jgi:hypothetical protein